jgi:hypothetical protein
VPRPRPSGRITKRDLLDATNHLLMTETFRPAAEGHRGESGERMVALGDLLGRSVPVIRIRRQGWSRVVGRHGRRSGFEQVGAGSERSSLAVARGVPAPHDCPRSLPELVIEARSIACVIISGMRRDDAPGYSRPLESLARAGDARGPAHRAAWGLIADPRRSDLSSTPSSRSTRAGRPGRRSRRHVRLHTGASS